ncbi:uncharacterized protein EAE97_001882 [Botrytis byssoidea]|uniref:Uncharacterized protein n=1 Tax=Botrytis byssoidea TaxID=139641 RepID=A0A9P5ISP9_9HELO|nr:uncharacterized protein EAE97_001882 [Botrytis byssoidea]KAF7952385.1 hypothetical protein EAE97_001882 [Botrytis byssoidea]
MNNPNNVTSGLYCEIDRFRCSKCEHDDYRHRYRCQRHLIGDAYCREAIPMITPDRNVFCRDCAEEEIIGSDDLDISNQGRMSPELPATRDVPVSSNITQGGRAEVQPVPTNVLQSPGLADQHMAPGGWNEPGGVQLSTLNPQSSAHVSPDQDLAITSVASENDPSAPQSSENSNTTTAPPPTPPPTRAAEPTPPSTPAPEPTPPSTPVPGPAPGPSQEPEPSPAPEPSPKPNPSPNPNLSPEPSAAPSPATRQPEIWATLRSWCCCTSTQSST